MVSLLDPRTWLAIIIGIAIAYATGAGLQRRSDLKAFEAEKNSMALAAASQQLLAVAEARQEEQRRTHEQTRIAQDATKQAENARADAGAATDAAGRLRTRIAELLAAGRASKDSSAAGTGAPAKSTDALLAELFRRADYRAGILAEDLDAARIAGQACERAYDTLTISEPGLTKADQ